MRIARSSETCFATDCKEPVKAVGRRKDGELTYVCEKHYDQFVKEIREERS